MPRKSRKYLRRKSRKSFRSRSLRRTNNKSALSRSKSGGVAVPPTQSYTFRVNLISEVGLPVPMTNDLAELVRNHLQAVKTQAAQGQFTNFQFQHVGENVFSVSFVDNYAGFPIGVQHTCQGITYLTMPMKTLMVNANLVYRIEIVCEQPVNNAANENVNMNVNENAAMQA
jgi:hypothetical protein